MRVSLYIVYTEMIYIYFVSGIINLFKSHVKLK